MAWSEKGSLSQKSKGIMKISNIEFDDSEETRLWEMAEQQLGHRLGAISPANLVRAALGFPLRQRGGAREGTGPKSRTKMKKQNKNGKK